MGLPFGCGCTTVTAEAVNVPGSDGAAGTNGNNAYTALTATLTIPAIGANVTATVSNAYFLAFGQHVAIGSSTIGVAHFKVAANVSSATSVVLTFLGYPGDAAPAAVLPIGSIVSPAGPWGLPTPLTVYAAGTAYSLTATSALLALGTTTPSLVISTPGTYLLHARARIDYGGAAVTAGRVVTLKLRKTNNTAGDVAGATAAFKTVAVTTETNTAQIVTIPPVVYTTANATDIVQLWGGVDTLDAADNLKAVEAEIVAVRLY